MGANFLENLFRQLITPLEKLVDAINRLISLLPMRSDRYARIQNILSSAVVNSFPTYHLGMNIPVAMTKIAENISAHYIAVRIFNNDPALPLLYGRDNLTLINGEILPAGNTMVRVLAPNDVLYGMSAGAVNIRVAVLESLNVELQKLEDEQLLSSGKG